MKKLVTISALLFTALSCSTNYAMEAVYSYMLNFVGYRQPKPANNILVQELIGNHMVTVKIKDQTFSSYNRMNDEAGTIWEQDKHIFYEIIQYIPGKENIIILFDGDKRLAYCKAFIDNTVTIGIGSRWLDQITQEAKRSVLCHEISHYILGHVTSQGIQVKKEKFDEGTDAYHRECKMREKAADLYAAQLLGTAKDAINSFQQQYEQTVETSFEFLRICCDIWQNIANANLISPQEITSCQNAIRQCTFDSKSFNQIMQQRVTDYLNKNNLTKAQEYVTKQLSDPYVNHMINIDTLNLDPCHPTLLERITYLTQWQNEHTS